MNTYTATFSTGKVTRKSEHEYRYAVALVNKSTGKIGKVTFTASATPSPDWSGIVASCPRNYGSANDRARWQREIDAEKAQWTVEIVEVTN